MLTVKLDGTKWPMSLQHFHWSVLLWRNLYWSMKRIRNDFDALAEKLATRGVAAESFKWTQKLDVKRRELLIKSQQGTQSSATLLQMGIAQAKRNKGRCFRTNRSNAKVSAAIKEDIELYIWYTNCLYILLTFDTSDDYIITYVVFQQNVEVRRWEHLVNLILKLKHTGVLGKTLVSLDWEHSVLSH